MAGSKISGTLTHGITLGTGTYSNRLIITKTGEITGNTGGVYSQLNDSLIINKGSIYVSAGAPVYLGMATASSSAAVGGTLINEGRIVQGSGEPGVILGIGNTAINYGVISAGGIHSSTVAFYMAGSSLDNISLISGGDFEDGVIEKAGGEITNSGTIGGLMSAVSMYTGNILNSGTINGRFNGLDLSDATGTNTSSGIILTNSDFGTDMGLKLEGNSYFNNAGIISGTFQPTYGAYLDSSSGPGCTLNNSGSIIGRIGVELTYGTLINSGTIYGRYAAVSGTSFSLIVDPGAVFLGSVSNSSDIGLLELKGTTAGSLSGIGSEITGFNHISFASGSEWVIEGDKAGLMKGQEIDGFTLGDTIVIDKFTAQSEKYVKGVGLVLKHAGKNFTLGIAGDLRTQDFTVTRQGGNTTISLAVTPSLDQALVLDPANDAGSSKMEFLNPLAGMAGISLTDHSAYNKADLFADIRSAKSAAASYLPRAAAVPSCASVAVTTLSAHGFSSAAMSLSETASQHDPKIAPISSFGFVRFP